MERILNLVGKNSNEIYSLRYPRSVLNFCDYDLTYFAENAITACDEALRTGEPDIDRMTDLRNSLKNAHAYIEHHLRTTYDKIALDCWIDYVCRRDGIGTSTLWNRFMGCRTAFEKSVFVRLCEYRYNKGINEWLNLVRVQDYAKNKISFIFSRELSGVEEAAARRNYFDLMFSVTAKELGCQLDELGVTKVFSVGRLPAAPFMFPTISKDIIKNLLADFDYSEDYTDNENYGSLSDQIAMDAFAHMKQGLAGEYDSYNISRSAMEKSPAKVYMPVGLKAAVDLEIDALIESGGWLARCKRCGRYFVRDSEHTEEYCSLFNRGGKTCLEIYEAEHPRQVITPELERRYREITDEVYSRVGTQMSLHEYESWKTYLDALYGKVVSGEIPAEELTSFINYSGSLDISRSNPVLEVPKREPEPRRERVVKPFVPQRIERSELLAQQGKKTADESAEQDDEQGDNRSFFTSPSVERQKQERGSISHIIKGEQRQERRNGFQTFNGADFAQNQQREGGFQAFNGADFAQNQQRESGFQMFNGADFAQNQQREGGFQTSNGSDFTQNQQRESGFQTFNGADFTQEQPHEAPQESVQKPSEQPAERPVQHVIRKNAAALSAYGKMSGAPLVTAPIEPPAYSEPAEEQEAVNLPNISDAEPLPEDPYSSVGSIFDLLAQSEEEMSKPEPKAKAATPPEDPSTEPSLVTKDNAPSGIWTEERHLFPEESSHAQELTMLKEKKRGRSSKTQRLFDAIMREPDANPNVRKK